MIADVTVVRAPYVCFLKNRDADFQEHYKTLVSKTGRRGNVVSQTVKSRIMPSGPFYGAAITGPQRVVGVVGSPWHSCRGSLFGFIEK